MASRCPQKCGSLADISSPDPAPSPPHAAEEMLVVLVGRLAAAILLYAGLWMFDASVPKHSYSWLRVHRQKRDVHVLMTWTLL